AAQAETAQERQYEGELEAQPATRRPALVLPARVPGALRIRRPAVGATVPVDLAVDVVVEVVVAVRLLVEAVRGAARILGVVGIPVAVVVQPVGTLGRQEEGGERGVRGRRRGVVVLRAAVRPEEEVVAAAPAALRGRRAQRLR